MATSRNHDVMDIQHRRPFLPSRLRQRRANTTPSHYYIHAHPPTTTIHRLLPVHTQPSLPLLFHKLIPTPSIGASIHPYVPITKPSSTHPYHSTLAYLPHPHFPQRHPTTHEPRQQHTRAALGSDRLTRVKITSIPKHTRLELS